MNSNKKILYLKIQIKKFTHSTYSIDKPFNLAPPEPNFVSYTSISKRHAKTLNSENAYS